MIGEILQGTYRIERLIGKGTMGVVYEASHLRISRRFAVKILSPALVSNREMMARFRQEAEITGATGHPHILQIVDFTMLKGCPCIVTELLVGENLGQRIMRERQLSLAAASSIFSQAASALEAVHGCGVVHRDLKPNNIFLCYDGRDDDFVRVLDFGISKVLGAEQSLTSNDAVLGSPQYMAPEQALGRSAEVDRRCDVYAMGIILYEMLVGETPFESARSLSELLQAIIQDPVPPIRARRPDLPAGLEQVLQRALAKDASRRYDSMADLWVALEEALGHRDAALAARGSAAALLQVATRSAWKPRLDADDEMRTLIEASPELGLPATELDFDAESTMPSASPALIREVSAERHLLKRLLDEADDGEPTLAEDARPTTRSEVPLPTSTPGPPRSLAGPEPAGWSPAALLILVGVVVLVGAAVGVIVWAIRG